MNQSIFHSKKYDSFFKLLESQKCILIALTILVLTGSFLRIYGVSHVYTEYDDIGVVSIHKAHVGSKEINPIEGLIDYPIKVDMESAHSIENNLFDELSACVNDSLDISNKSKLLESLNQSMPVNCKDATFKILGVSLAAINTILSVLIVIFSIRTLTYEEN